jgi:hypothetical protein
LVSSVTISNSFAVIALSRLSVNAPTAITIAQSTVTLVLVAVNTVVSYEATAAGIGCLMDSNVTLHFFRHFRPY